ncbi:SigE family RNA polymerase sigma factor [Enemella evansiae]|nr:SigE family RNA polymerase sigma factor [Enemella evansiae]
MDAVKHSPRAAEPAGWPVSCGKVTTTARGRCVARADRDAEFAEFVRERSPRLLAFARGLCGDPTLAEDLTQGALEKAYLKWHRVRATDDPTSYVRRILVNHYRDRLRRRPWREQSTDFDPGGAPLDAAAAHRLDGDDRPDRAASVADRESVRAALAGLTARERAVVVLRFLEDLSEADTAAALGIKVGTVKSACARALGKLREAPDIQGLQEAG